MEPPGPPRYSEDGRFYWDGQHWVPVPAAPGPAPVIVKGVVRTAPARWRYVFWLLLIAGILFFVVCSWATYSGGGAGPVPALTGHKLHGVFTLSGQNDGITAACSGTGGYDDIHAGAAVTVRDEASKVIGTSTLGAGRASGANCVFEFDVTGLPDVNYYAVEVSHRGSVTFSKSDLNGYGWTVQLSLGHA